MSKRVALLLSCIILLIIASFVFLSCRITLPGETTTVKVNDTDAFLAKSFLKGYGIGAEFLPEETKSLVLPPETDTVMREYYSLQAENGAPILQFIGREVSVLTFLVSDFCGAAEEIPLYAHCYICDSTVIAADICSADLSGFMSGLRFPEG